MSKPGYRCVRSFPSLLVLALICCAFALSPQAQAETRETGHFDLSIPGESYPSAWSWVENSTSDGDGTEYVAYLATHPVGGASNPNIDTNATYVAGGSHTGVQAFADWIVANNSHVDNTAALTVVQRVVTAVPVN